MSYKLYKHIEVQNKDSFTIRLLKKDYNGSSFRWEGWADQGTYRHERSTISPDNIWENPFQKGTLKVFFVVKTQTHLNLLKEIFKADEDEYRLQKVENGQVTWTGKVLPGRLSYTAGPFPFMGTIIAKDISHLQGEDFALEDTRETLIETIARLLPYDLPIHTYTSWTHGSISAADDFLNQIFHDTIVFRKIDNSSSLAEEPWSKYKSVTEIARANKLIIRQEDNVWQIFQLSELARRPKQARRTVYDSTGVKQSIGPVDLVDTLGSVRWVLPSSQNNHKEALKQTSLIHRHRSGNSVIDFETIPGNTYPGGAVDTEEDDYYIASQPFTGNGDEKLKFNARIQQEVSTTSAQDTHYAITIGDFILDEDLTWKNSPQLLTRDSYVRFSDNGVNLTDGVITEVAHTNEAENGPLFFQENIPVRLYAGSGSLPDGLEAGQTYYVINLEQSGSWSFQLASTPNGTPIVPDTIGSGSQLYVYHIGVLVDLFKGQVTSTGNIIDILTDDIPDGAEGDLKIFLPAFPVGDFNAVYWFNVSASIQNPTQAGEEFEYRLTQTGIYSLKKDEGNPPVLFFGDGPYAYSRGSYRTSLNLSDITIQSWTRRGEGMINTSHAEINLKEELDLRRSGRRCLQAQLFGSYKTHRLIEYDGDYLFFLEGVQTGFDNLYDGEFFALDIEEDS